MASATIKYNIHDYFSADAVLGKRASKVIGYRTILIRESEISIVVKYIDTIIALFHVNHVTFNTGGWKTYTTKDRLNQLIPAPWTIYQLNHEWLVRNHETGQELPWRDGIMFLTNQGSTG